ncbi:unnamed protein product [Penicillium salamii]|uniref:RTA-like protein n=1 Tax=Penicillium salamii TaxID=1612424 RepID=A0A9W4NGJ5_9EURO|nr:unnamed protein product [Penicillium salamii]CAG8312047.1 unnamed protein product [Penicillium salamii]CAG8338977.1 unnamed protein product [Penicillium salamii]CAG8363933.1 unnamed protein product [Penicillium salamii]CAG8373512.1 unnamed protein product [Penicillium salamii]
MGDWSFYDYSPSKVGAIIALLFYGASAGYHVFQLVKLKSYFFATFIIGAISELYSDGTLPTRLANLFGKVMTLGYIFRAVSAGDQTALGPYIAQNVCILLPPSLYAATIYMIYGRIVIYAKEQALSIVSPLKVTKIFVIGDVLAFLTQATGGGMMAIASMSRMGQIITIVGLFIQLIFFGAFLSISIIFGRRVQRSKTSLLNLPYGVLLYVLFAVSALIIVRCLYRIVEFCQGNDGYLMNHEAFMYVFDTIPMFIVQVVFHFYHPGKILSPESYCGVGSEMR